MRNLTQFRTASALFVVAGIAFSAACGQKALKAIATPTALVISPNSGTLFVGQTITMQVVTAINNNTTQTVQASTVTWSSSLPSALTVNAGVLTAVGAGTGVVITGKWSGLSATATFNVNGASLKSLSVEPNPARVAVGETIALQVQGTLTDGTTVDLTQAASGTTYSSSESSVASMSVDGVITGDAVGTSTVTVANTGITATTGVIVTAQPVTLTQLTLAPAWQSLNVGATGMVTLTAAFSDNSTMDVTNDPTTLWSTSDPTLLTAATGGVLTAIAPGADVALVGSYGGLRASASIDIVGSMLVSIAILPSQVTLPLNGTATLMVIATYSDGSTQDVTSNPNLVWSSSNTALVSVNDAVVMGEAAGGPTTVTALLNSQMATCSVTVLATTLTSLTISPATGIVPLRGAIQLTVIGTMSDGSTTDLTLAAAGTSYTSASNAALSVGVNGLAQGWQVSGVVAVTATNSGQTATAQLSVTAGADQIVTLTISPSDTRIAVQQPLALRVTATYGDGHTADVTSASTGTVYSPSNPLVVSVTPDGVVTGLAVGSVTVTAANSGASATATIGVGAPAATVTGLTVTPPAITGDAGTTTQLVVTGKFSDGSSNNLTAASQGTTYSISGNPAVASVSAGGLVTLESSGSCAVLVQNGSVEAAVQITVNTRTITQLEVTPNSLQVPVGFIVQLQVTGLFSDGSTEDLTSPSTGTAYGIVTQRGRFNSNAATAASVASDGVVTALAVGRASISVASQGLTARANINVVTATVSGVSASAATPSVPVGLTTQVTCNATLSGGQVVNVTSATDGTQWVSGNSSVLTVDSNGLATGVAAGTASVTCLNNGQAASVSVGVTQAVAQSVTVNPSSASIPVGVPLALSVTVLFSNGTSGDASSGVSGTTYISSDLSAVSVTSNGVVTGLTAGAMAAITVLVAGQTQTVAITVLPPVIESIAFVDSPFSTVIGATSTVQVTGVFSDGTTRPIDSAMGLSFTVADPAIATVDANGDLSGVAAGSTTVYAYAGGQSAQATVTVTGM